MIVSRLAPITLSLFFCVEGRRYLGKNNVNVCHIPPGNEANYHMISVSPAAAHKHVENHGDLYGTCLENCDEICDLLHGNVRNEDEFECAGKGILVEDPLKGQELADLDTTFWEVFCDGYGNLCDTTTAPSAFDVGADGTTLLDWATQNYIGYEGGPGVGPDDVFTKWAYFGNGDGFEISFLLKNLQEGRYHATLSQLNGDPDICTSRYTIGVWDATFGVWGGSDSGTLPSEDHYDMGGFDANEEAYFTIRVKEDKVTILRNCEATTVTEVAAQSGLPYFFYFGFAGSGTYRVRDFKLKVFSKDNFISCPSNVDVPAGWETYPCITECMEPL
uniref:Uncharacterized protein n=1 Tax=Amphora coffeiformis TaxID=265554 RepID=A0A7S3L5P5_9STRA|mmetsp:Transcript_16403/g.33070  ORF Transcript_16403/g.33070 Transcript_16403/m.33070 type:complete len:332 (+) Transcript_16403:44-1039(+)|eukprot:scaffold5479_cov199-Amphora_coffeaeformis.AAC.9